jgi:hypothetical protein
MGTRMDRPRRSRYVYRVVSATPIDDPLDTDHSYSDCVRALGDMPDAIDHHIDACQAVEAAGAAMR